MLARVVRLVHTAYCSTTFAVVVRNNDVPTERAGQRETLLWVEVQVRSLRQ